MTATPDIEALVAELRDEKRFHQDEVLWGKLKRAIAALERTQAVVEVAHRYTRHYDAHEWSKAMKAITDLRVTVRSLAALDAPPEIKL